MTGFYISHSDLFPLYLLNDLSTRSLGQDVVRLGFWVRTSEAIWLSGLGLKKSQDVRQLWSTEDRVHLPSDTDWGSEVDFGMGF